MEGITCLIFKLHSENVEIPKYKEVEIPVPKDSEIYEYINSSVEWGILGVEWKPKHLIIKNENKEEQHIQLIRIFYVFLTDKLNKIFKSQIVEIKEDQQFQYDDDCPPEFSSFYMK